jgi:hypothetical protein
MSKKVRKVIGLLIAVFLSACLFLSPLYMTKSYAADPYTALSKATRKYNGHDYSGEYNPLYYYLNYQDLRDAFGTDGNKLIEHYVVFGKKEKRVANKLIGDSTEFVVPTGKENMVIIPKTLHGNGGMTADQEVQARSIAKQIADGINKTATDKVKDIEKVAYAAGIVRAYCDLGTYTTSGQMYRTAYGVFIGGEYSCAGSTRALGLILDYLGITWVHVNANTWDDQWCQVIADGQEGYGDAIKATAAYGKHPNQGGDAKTAISYSKIRSKFDVATQKPRQTD